MSILTYPLGFIGGGKEFYNDVIENSLRITHANTGGNAYLRQTQSAEGGNRKTWTLSWWEKRGASTDDEINWELGNADGSHWAIARVRTGGGTVFYDYDSPTDYGLKTDNVFRDPAAWYHFVIAVDTTIEYNLDRVKLFINGKRHTLVDQYGIPTQNFETRHNIASGLLAIGERPGDSPASSTKGHGYITDAYSIDGYALSPENFGEYKEGVWIPKALQGHHL